MAADVRVRAPLFDRLAGGEGSVQTGAFPVRLLDRKGLINSVCRELEQLFNTRCSLPAHELDRRERTVIDYGIPDFTHLSPKHPEDRKRLIASLTQAVSAYEPRIRNVHIVVDESVVEDQSLRIRIEAELVVDPVGEVVSFESVVPTKGGRSQVHARD